MFSCERYYFSKVVLYPDAAQNYCGFWILEYECVKLIFNKGG